MGNKILTESNHKFRSTLTHKEGISSEERLLLGDYNDVCKLLKARERQRGIDFYRPNPIQMAAHKSKARTIAFVAGNRSGKSTFGAAELSFHLTRKYPSWYPIERRFNRPLKIRIATDKFFKIDSVIEPKIRAYIPADEITRVKRSPQGFITKLATKHGDTIEFLTMEQDLMAFEGQDLDIFWGDEPVDRGRYIATQRGLIDRGGLTILTFTPLVEPWMKEEIVDKADGVEVEVFTANTRDNKFDVDGNPILLEADIKRFEDLLSEDEKKVRIEGHFYHLRGLVYKGLGAPHIIDAETFKYEEGYPVIGALDPHDRLPHWMIWVMVDRINDVFVMDEMIIEGTIAELAASIKAREQYYGWNVVKRVIDPNFGRTPLTGTGVSVIEELRKFRVYFAEANDNKEFGRLKVKEMLHYNMAKPIDINNKPKLYFVKNKVPRTWRSVQNHQFDEWRTGVDKDPKEKEKEKDTHGADVVRYIAVSNPEFYVPQAYEPRMAGAYY